MTNTDLRNAVHYADLKCAHLAAFGTDEEWRAARIDYDRLVAEWEAR